ncbi:MAG: type II secretion system major pseudopilin GspG [Gammaproteobacteria bacterium]|nr:type II secretion system major pseudopilin GspG [Gammaproteobacteria bacterium]
MKRHQGGFSLLEIMVVVVIIGILVATIAPTLFGETEKARLTRVKVDLAALEDALERYKMDNFNYPTTDQGLEALVEQSNLPPEPKHFKQGGYVRRMQKDPWGNDYQYITPGQASSYDLFSLGADGEAGGEGENMDIGNWNLGELE